MKHILALTALALLAGCAGFSQTDNAASGSTASDDSAPLYLQNPANCAEAGPYCRGR